MVECIQLWPLIFKWFAIETYSRQVFLTKILRLFNLAQSVEWRENYTEPKQAFIT